MSMLVTDIEDELIEHIERQFGQFDKVECPATRLYDGDRVTCTIFGSNGSINIDLIAEVEGNSMTFQLVNPEETK